MRTRAELTPEMLERYRREFPYMNISQLARLIADRENFRSWESLRGKIRSMIGEGYVPKDVDFEREPEEINLFPESWYREVSDFEIMGPARIAVLGDIHIPFHSESNLRVALDFVSSWGTDILLLNGDIMDCYALSTFMRDPKLRDFDNEKRIMEKFFDYLFKRFSNIRIIYKFGNHELRWQYYLWRKAEEIGGMAELRLENLLHLRERGIDYVEAGQLIRCGKLNILHGHEIYGARGSVNVARNFRLKASDNILVNHFHRVQEDVVTNVRGKEIGAWAVGCLCGLRPPYRPISDWMAGFALVELDYDGDFTVYNKKIIDKRVVR